MASRLSIYNGALRAVGERQLKSLTDDVEARYQLDSVWDNKYLERVLKRGQWNFAIRTSLLSYEPSINPEFGYAYAFPHPDDYVRLVGISTDEYFTESLINYRSEARHFWADNEEIYVRYVSDGPDYGGDIANWPEDFSAFVEVWFAAQITPGFTQGDGSDIDKKLSKALNIAQSTDAQESEPRFAPASSWVKARRGRGGIERGSNRRLIG